MNERDIKFEQTCGGCPEAYLLLYNNDEVGYLKLRSGHLGLTAGKYVSIFANDRSECIDVWDHYFDGDPYKGMFDDEAERNHFKELAVEKLIEYYER